METPAGWRERADTWFKFLGAVVFGYLILSQVVVLVRQFADAAIILAGSLLLAYFVLPIVNWLRRRMPLWAAISIVYVSGLLAVIAIGFVVIPTLSAQFSTLLHNIPAIQATVEQFFRDRHNPVLSKLPAFVQTWLQKLPAQIADQLQRNAVSYSSSIVNALGALTFIAALAVALPVVSIYLIAEAPKMRDFVLSRLPARSRTATSDVLSDIDSVLGGFIRGQLIVALSVGIMATIALLILRVPYALLIGAWAGIADIIPYLGPIAGALPAGIVAIVYQGWGSSIGIAISFALINQIEGHLLGPRIVSRTVRISPLGVIFALLISAQLFGFAGLIVAVPLAGLVRVALVRAFPQRHAPRSAGTTG